jgi:hypothetical protein
LYPFTSTPSDLTIDSESLIKCLSKERVLDNHIEVNTRGAVNLYSAIVDSAENGYVLGRFVKLKTDNIETIDKKTFFEDLTIIGEDKYIEENAYFAWNLATNLLLAQWKPDSLNVLTGNSNRILQKACDECSFRHYIKIEPFPSKEFIQNIIQNKGIVSKYRLSFKELGKPYLEEQGLSSDVVWQIADDQEVEMDLVIRLGRRPELSESLFGKLTSIARRILFGTNKFVVYTDEGNFDLIGEKAIYYSETVTILDDLGLYRKEIYKTIKQKLMAETNNLLEIRKRTDAKKPTLDKF